MSEAAYKRQFTVFNISYLFNVYFFFQCKPPPPKSGPIKFGDTTEECTQGIIGTVRYSTSQNALELCDGSSWSPLVTTGLGQTPEMPGLHCRDILESGEFYSHLHQSNVQSLILVSRDVIKF